MESGQGPSEVSFRTPSLACAVEGTLGHSTSSERLLAGLNAYLALSLRRQERSEPSSPVWHTLKSDLHKGEPLILTALEHFPAKWIRCAIKNASVKETRADST
jgi:hypothetical protein